MQKPVVAVLFGGCSSEYSVSLHSARAVLAALDRNKYQIVPVGITREGNWFHYTGPLETLEEDTWTRNPACLTPAALSQDRSRRALLTFPPDRVVPIRLDAAFPVLHGRNGEDGTVQGLLQLAGIPTAGCGVLSSALCMDKVRAHRLAAEDGVAVPLGMVLTPDTPRQAALDFVRQAGLPLFVKPVRSGSSHGITRVTREGDLDRAIDLAFRHDRRVLLEQAIPGFEVGCAILGTDKLTIGELDEIELSGGFFDFEEKYTLKTSAIHVPARVSPEVAARVKDTARQVYRALDCAGFARVDLFVTPQGEVYFNEVNTIPGFTEHSRFPAMLQAAGLSFPEMLDAILCQVVSP